MPNLPGIASALPRFDTYLYQIGEDYYSKVVLDREFNGGGNVDGLVVVNILITIWMVHTDDHATMQNLVSKIATRIKSKHSYKLAANVPSGNGRDGNPLTLQRCAVLFHPRFNVEPYSLDYHYSESMSVGSEAEYNDKLDDMEHQYNYHVKLHVDSSLSASNAQRDVELLDGRAKYHVTQRNADLRNIAAKTATAIAYARQARPNKTHIKEVCEKGIELELNQLANTIQTEEAKGTRTAISMRDAMKVDFDRMREVALAARGCPGPKLDAVAPAADTKCDPAGGAGDGLYNIALRHGKATTLPDLKNQVLKAAQVVDLVYRYAKSHCTRRVNEDKQASDALDRAKAAAAAAKAKATDVRGAVYSVVTPKDVILATRNAAKATGATAASVQAAVQNAVDARTDEKAADYVAAKAREAMFVVMDVMGAAIEVHGDGSKKSPDMVAAAQTEADVRFDDQIDRTFDEFLHLPNTNAASYRHFVSCVEDGGVAQVANA